MGINKSLQKYVDEYVFSTILPGSKQEIKFKPISLGHIKKLAKHSDVTDKVEMEEILDEMLNECVIDENFNVDELLVGDRMFLLLEIRIHSKGSNYEFQRICDGERTLDNGEKVKCNSQRLEVFDLKKLNIVKLSKDIDKNIEFGNKISVKLSHITRGKEKEAYKLYGDLKKELFKGVKNDDVKKEREMEAEVELANYLLTYAIEEISTPDGKVEGITFEDKMYLINSLTEEDYDKISTWFADNEFGLDLSFESECTECGTEFIMEVPINSFFI